MTDRPPVRVAVLDGPDVRLHQLELPDRPPGQTDVAVTLAAICGSDVHTVQGDRPAPPLAALGHEAVGRVAAADPDATDLRGVPLRPGDRVALSMINSCGRCDRCAHGLSMKCRSLFKYGHASAAEPPYASGMLAELVRVLPGTPVLRIPDDVPDALVVSAGCAVATAVAVLSAVTVAEGDEVVVTGAGAVGFYCAAMLATAGATVTVHDPSPQRRALVAGLGVRTEGCPPEPRSRTGDGPAVVVEASGHPDAVTGALRCVGTGGHVVAAGSVSPGSTSITIDPALLVTGRIRLTGVHNYGAEEFARGVDWLLEHGDALPVDRLTAPPVPLAAVAGAIAAVPTASHLRLTVRP